jgi:hypothetical protein
MAWLDEFGLEVRALQARLIARQLRREGLPAFALLAERALRRTASVEEAVERVRAQSRSLRKLLVSTAVALVGCGVLALLINQHGWPQNPFDRVEAPGRPILSMARPGGEGSIRSA